MINFYCYIVSLRSLLHCFIVKWLREAMINFYCYIVPPSAYGCIVKWLYCSASLMVKWLRKAL